MKHHFPVIKQPVIVLATALATTLTLGGCSPQPTIQTGEDAEVIMGNLNRVDNARMQLAYVDPAADYSRYSRVLINPLDLDHVEIVQPSNSSLAGRSRDTWELTDRDRAALQQAFRESMEKQLTDGGDFAIADSAAEDVLTISAMVTRIAPNAPKDDFASRGSGRSRVYSEGSGSISIAVAFADGLSDEVLALIKDTRRDNNASWGVNNAVTNLADARRSFSAWAKQIHDGLLALRLRADAEPAQTR